MKSNSAECFVETEGVFRAREFRRLAQEDRWDKEVINNVIGVPWRIVDGKWPVDRPTIQIDPLPPPPPVPFEGARRQRESITRADVEAFGTIAGCPGCNATRSGKRARAHSDLCRARIEECLRTTPEGSERSDRRREVLNEALRREEAESAAGELAVPRESKYVPIPPDSDSRKRRAMKAATVDASSGRSQSESSFAVADESMMDVEGEERRIQKFDRTEHQEEES